MAEQVVTQLIVDSSGVVAGMAAFEAAMTKAKGSFENLDTSTKSYDLSQRNLQKVMASNDPIFAAQLKMKAELARQETVLSQSVKLHQISQTEMQSVLGATTTRWNSQIQALKDSAFSHTTLGKAMSGVGGQLVAISAGAGPVGVFLSALGPWGMAAAVGVGLVSAAFEEAQRTAHLLATEAVSLEKFSEVTGLSTDTLQALTQAAAKHGVSAEETTTAIVKFTKAWAEAREGGGQFLTQLQKNAPALADDIQRTNNSTVALGKFLQAIKAADDAGNIAARNRLAQAAGGRGTGGITAFVGLANTVDAAGGLGSLTKNAVDAGKAIQEKLLNEVNTLQTEIDETRKRADLLFGTIGAEPILKTELAWQNMRVEMAMTMAELEKHDAALTAWQKFWKAFNDFQEGGAGRIPLPTRDNAAPLPASPSGRVTRGADLPDLTAPKDMKAQLADLQKEISLMGAAASATDKYNLRIKELNAAIDANSTPETKAAAERGKSIAALERDTQQLSLHNSTLGVAATVADVVAEKTAALNLKIAQHANLTDAQEKNQRRLIQAQADGTLALQAQIDATNVQIGMMGKSVAEAESYRIVQTKINENRRLRLPLDQKVNQALADEAGVRKQAADTLKQYNDLLFQQAQLGRSAADQAAASAARSIWGDKYLDHLNDQNAALAKQIELTKQRNDYANVAGQAMLSALAQGKSPKEAVGSAINAAGTKMSGDMMTAGIATGNPAMIGVAIGIAALQGQAAKAKQAKADFDAAVDAWGKMAGEVAKFTDQLTNKNTGSLGGAIADATQKAQQYADAAHKAGQSSDALNAALIVFVQRVTRDFIVSFDTSIEALNQGLGDNSPAVKAQQNVKSIGDKLKGFIDDTVHAGQGLAQAGPAIAAATASSQKYALSLLQTEPVLTTVQTAILTLRGGAAQLQTTLQDLGMSADAAGLAISTGIKTALAQISATFTQGLQAQINSATGKDYINSLNTLLLTGVSNLNDAQSLGLDPALVAQTFQAQAQQIVDSAGLVGSAFDDLMKTFPNLTGVIHQSTTAIQQQIDANTQFYTSLKTTIGGYLDNLKQGANSTLSPQDKLNAAQGAYNLQLGMAQGGDRTALGSITQYSDALLSAAKDFFASGSGFQSIFSSVTSQLTSLPGDAQANDPIVNAIKGTTAAVDSTGATLIALKSLQAATTQSSVDISASVTQLGQQGAFVADQQGSQYFGPMNAFLSQIEVNTRLSGQAASDPGSGFQWYNPFTWFHEGGVVGAYAPGGLVGNGVWNMDSVRARYAGGGDILLAGGEGIINSAATRMIGPSTIDLMNRTGQLPSSASNDNGEHFQNLGQTLVRAMVGVSMAEINAMREDNALLRAEVRRLSDAMKVDRTRRRTPGTQTQANAA